MEDFEVHPVGTAARLQAMTLAKPVNGSRGEHVDPKVWGQASSTDFLPHVDDPMAWRERAVRAEGKVAKVEALLNAWQLGAPFPTYADLRGAIEG